MSKEAIVERILSDAGAEAEAIIKDAEEKAAAVVAAASSRAEKGRRDSEAEVKVKTGSIFERKAATARLDCAKILLSEKRGSSTPSIKRRWINSSRSRKKNVWL